MALQFIDLALHEFWFQLGDGNTWVKNSSIFDQKESL
jgi:hypothetical protein